MSTLADIGRLFASALTEGRGLADLQFRHSDAARLTIVVLVAVALAMIVVRSTIIRKTPRHRVALPALLRPRVSFSWNYVRHTPLVVLMVGLPWFIVALADPYSSLTQREETFPGRRICLMIDASSSMVRPFSAPTLRKPGSVSQATFLTAVAAADRFVQLRTKGKYRDLMALV